jgi:hypothetical protein
MNISKLALIALLGSALMAFGCSDDASGDGGTGGGTGGTGGGTGGTGGTPEVPAGLYTFSCALSSFDLPVTVQINAEDPGFTEGEASSLTTKLDFNVAPDIIGLLPSVAPEAMVEDVTSTIAIVGATPATIDHVVEVVPFAPVAEFPSDELMTDVTPDAMATEVSLSVSTMTTVISGIPDALVPGGTLTLTAGEGDCGELAPADGSGPVTFSVTAAM